MKPNITLFFILMLGSIFICLHYSVPLHTFALNHISKIAQSKSETLTKLSNTSALDSLKIESISPKAELNCAKVESNSPKIQSDENKIVPDHRFCACTHCISKPNVSEWFDKRFNSTAHPLLSKTNSNLSEEQYQFWMQLQPQNPSASYDVIIQRLLELFPSEDNYLDQSPSRCRSCAIVGNSDNLSGSNYGTMIEEHDFVMRVNRGKTEGYEKDVGAKTTHHFMYPESATNLKNNTRLVLVPFKIIDLQWLISVATKSKVNHTYESVLSTLEFNKAKVLVYHPAFIKYVYDIWTEKHGRYPSTGFLVLIFALHVCDEVNVYGYGANSKGEWKHYWENITDSPYPSVHSGDSEYNTILKLDDIGKIKLYKGIKT